MTNEELERTMNFIIEGQERITKLQEQTQTTLGELARRDTENNGSDSFLSSDSRKLLILQEGLN